MGKVKENQQKKKQRLLETAFQLFISKGINETTIQDIAEAAGIAKGTFYLYFKDKYELIEKLRGQKTVQLFEEAVAFSRHVTYENFTEQLLVIIGYIIDELTKKQDLLRFIYKNLSMGIVDIPMDIEGRENFSTAVYELFEQRVIEEHLTIENPKTTLFMVVELVGSTCYNSILYQLPLPIDQFKPELNEAIRRLLG